jgi:DNA-binding NarL/FixJ family response regulator
MPSAYCLIVEDNHETREFLAGIVSAAFPELTIHTAGSVREAASVTTMLCSPKRAPIELALIDLSLPDGSGLDIIGQLVKLSPTTTIIVMTTFADDSSIFQSLTRGARGYILKSEPRHMIEQLLVRIRQGEPSLSPAVAIRVLNYFSRQAPPPGTPVEVLSQRERETLKLIAKGLTAAEVATELSLKPQTITSYIKVIYQKLNINSRAEAAREAIRRGLI